MNKIQLIKKLYIKVKHSSPVREGVEVWRVIVSFISDYPQKNRLVKDYFVWVTGEYLEDKAKLSADKNSAAKFALEFVKKDSKNPVIKYQLKTVFLVVIKRVLLWLIPKLMFILKNKNDQEPSFYFY